MTLLRSISGGTKFSRSSELQSLPTKGHGPSAPARRRSDMLPIENPLRSPICSGIDREATNPWRARGDMLSRRSPYRSPFAGRAIEFTAATLLLPLAACGERVGVKRAFARV